MTLNELNELSPEAAHTTFMQCCTASRWVDTMVSSRPFQSLQQCQDRALEHWSEMQEDDFLEAFAGHPKIGDVNSLRKKYAATKALASGEQSSVNVADERTLKGLADGNTKYEQQNGFIFIVCATGKSAAEMLQLLEDRLRNDRSMELAIAAEQQSQITALRIAKLITTDEEKSL